MNETDRDYFLYNGVIDRSATLSFMEAVNSDSSCQEATVLLVTNGGDPDAAYKMARYLQAKYEKFTVCLPGMCKSAGTLFATAAHEISFSPYGELGPLDIQISKRDDLAAQESGLNITEAFFSLDESARIAFRGMISEILRMSNGMISFQTASHSAAEIVTGLFSPVYAQIEPDEVGARSRAMRIGQEYAERLNEKYENLLPYGAGRLCQTYPSHSFVIDFEEAKTLFKNVRQVNQSETNLIKTLGDTARHQGQTLAIHCLNELVEVTTKGADNHAGTQHELGEGQRNPAGEQGEPGADPETNSGKKSNRSRSKTVEKD